MIRRKKISCVTERHLRRLAKESLTTDLELRTPCENGPLPEVSPPYHNISNTSSCLSPKNMCDSDPKLEDSDRFDNYDEHSVLNSEISIHSNDSTQFTLSNVSAASFDSEEFDCQNNSNSAEGHELINQDITEGRPLLTDIADWAVQHQITHVALTALLSVLRSHNVAEKIPKNARTLLKTPRTTEIRTVQLGQYRHFGIAEHVKRFLDRERSGGINLIELQVGIDGLPISGSSGNQLWPILGSIVPDSKVFLIGCFFGKKKPGCCNEYLQEFVDEAKDLVIHGIRYNGRNIAFQIHSIIGDTPAKSFFTGTKNHTGYYSCTKCVIRGERIGSRICFPQLNCAKRTDDSFKQQRQEEYHLKKTLLLEIPGFGAVSRIPLDYMHLLGIVKKLIEFWLAKDLEFRMTPTSLRVVSGLLIKLRDYIPVEFARRPRELDSYAKWKATEYRQLLLYTGPFVFRKNLKKQKYYKNFLVLHVAIRILSSSELLKHVDYAESLLSHFIRSFARLYGPQYVSHNVHTLSHLPDDVRKFGIIDSFSAFRYENYMKTLKKFIRKPDRPLQQLHRRYTEIQNSFVDLTKPVTGIIRKEEHSDGPLIDFCSDPQFRKIITSNYMLSGKRPNNCCGLGDDNLIVCIENFATSLEGECRIIGRAWTKVGPVYRKPCFSTVVGIYRVDELGPLQSWPFDSVRCKYMLIPYGRRSTAAISLLH